MAGRLALLMAHRWVVRRAELRALQMIGVKAHLWADKMVDQMAPR
jgi:hypothetical protein